MPRKVMIWPIVGFIGLVLTGIASLVTKYYEEKQRATDSELSKARHNQIVDNQISANQKLDILLTGIESDVDLRSSLQSDFPYGYVLYGYDETKTQVTPLNSNGPLRITCDWTKLEFIPNYEEGVFTLKVKGLEYIRKNDTQVGIKVGTFEWSKLSMNSDEPQEFVIIKDGDESLSLVVELLDRDNNGALVFAIGFLLRPDSYYANQGNGGGRPGSYGFYKRRLALAKKRSLGLETVDIGVLYRLMGDAVSDTNRTLAKDYYEKSEAVLSKFDSPEVIHTYANMAHLLSQTASLCDYTMIYVNKAFDAMEKHKDHDVYGVMMLKSIKANCLLHKGDAVQAELLLRQNAYDAAVLFYREGVLDQDVYTALNNWVNMISLNERRIDVVEAKVRELERSAFQEVRGSLKGFEPITTVKPSDRKV